MKMGGIDGPRAGIYCGIQDLGGCGMSGAGTVLSTCGTSGQHLGPPLYYGMRQLETSCMSLLVSSWEGF